MYRVIPYKPLHRGAQMKDQRRLLLVIAWLMFVASLPAPGLDQQIPVLGRLPLGLLLVVVVPAGAFYGHGGWFLPTAFSTILFLLSPWAANLSGVRPFALRMLVAIGMLGAWAYPIGFYIFLRPHGRAGQDGYAAPLWGYYLFTAACTLACAISLMGSCDRHHDDRRGFPVVANTDQGGGG